MIVPKQRFTSKDVARHYDDLDQIYRETWGEHLHHGLWTLEEASTQEAVENLAARVMERLGIEDGASVCDIGCGYAATARLIAERFSAHVTGFTISKAQLEQAELRNPARGKVTLHLRNWLENDLLNESFDHAFSIESSEHMEDQPRFFSESYRVLKTRGTFVVCAWLARDNPGPLERSLLLEPICRHGRILGLGSEVEYREMLGEAGFVLTCFEDLSLEVSRTWTICANRFMRSMSLSPSTLRLLLTLFRIRIAYSLGAMRYGVFTAVKPSSG